MLDNVTDGVPSRVRTVIEEACSMADVTLIHAQVRGNERQMRLEVTIDNVSGVTHEHCRAVSRTLDDRLGSDDFYGRLRAVEVSSPGADAPVVYLWQLKKSVGRTIECKLIDGTSIEGKLNLMTETELVLTPIAGTKKGASSPVSIPFGSILQARVVLSLR